MKIISVQKHIAAPPRQVWDILTDPKALVDGGTGIQKIEGILHAHSAFTLFADVAPGRGFKIKVTQFDPPKEMVWQSGFGPVFKGRRVFLLEQTPDGQATAFSMTETFTGLMLPLIWRSMPNLQPSFEQFADAIAALAEGESK